MDKDFEHILSTIKELYEENIALKSSLGDKKSLIQEIVSSCIQAEIKPIIHKVNLVQRTANEAVFASIFNNAIAHSEWLKNTAFSAGRWAVGYPYLYAMYRILNEVKPAKILELGLGQSTRMMAQYVAFHENTMHFVVEHDEEWIDFFQRDFALSENSKIVQLNWNFEKYNEAESVRVYDGFEEQFKDDKFDFISIDGPFGGDMKQYARIDVLKLLPKCLAENFIIMIDDTERSGETNTVKEMIKKLDENGVKHCLGRYSGQKDCTVISSENLKWVCSM